MHKIVLKMEEEISEEISRLFTILPEKGHDNGEDGLDQHRFIEHEQPKGIKGHIMIHYVSFSFVEGG